MKSPLIYHILIDRFAGCNAQREGIGFKGGSLRGIIQKLDYVQNLGAEGILLTPFYQSAAYHGYHITDFDKVDSHFGTWEDIDNLITEVHRRGMTLTADFVANHCHKDNPLFQKHPEWFKRKDDGTWDYFANIDYLPQFNLDHPDARQYMIERALNLCRRGFDGLRLDYAKGPSLQFWRSFRKAIKREYPKVWLIGEVWGKPERKRLPSDLARLVRPGCISFQEAWQLRFKGVFDGVLDFEYQHLMCETAKSGRGFLKNRRLQRALESHFSHYTQEYQPWLMLDNHDTNRFLFECRGDVNLLHEAVILSEKYVFPRVMYYGTECGMTNTEDIFDGTAHADERVRECMKWNY